MDKLELALDDCLEQLAAGTSSIGQCLARYPQYAEELRPLLETALRLQQGRLVRPSGAVRDRARTKLAHHIELHPRRTLRPMPRFAMGLVALTLALMVVTTAFAQAALPGQTLYGLKLSTERAWRAAAPDPIAVDISLADRRADELLSLVKERQHTVRDDDAESQGIAAYTDVLDRLATEADGASGAQVLTTLERHQQKLSEAGVNVPELDEIVSHGHNGQGNGPQHKP